MQIQKCTDQDLATLAKLNKCLIEDEKSDNKMSEEELLQRMREFLHTEYDAYFFMAEEEIVGYALVKNSCTPLYLRQFYIDRQYRRKHYGEQAFHELLKYLDVTTIDIEVLSWNEAGVRFWEKLNFKERSRYMRYNNCTEVWAYEMYYDKTIVPQTDIYCVPFKEEYFEEYKSIYNECFYEMRKALNIEPYNWYSQYSQMADKAEYVFLLLDDEQIIGSVACYGNEIDDLIVRKAYQKRGYGKQLLQWAMNHIRQHGDSEIILHVAEWNSGALGLYKNAGFTVRKREKVR